MRGEHCAKKRGLRFPVGSSPHARGAHASEELDDIDDGIIPACAGSTAVHLRVGSVHRDHPRMRGEHSSQTRWAFGRQGSSPHARGARLPPAHSHEPEGIIPACAGSTPWRSEAANSARDHPRMRGEHREGAYPGEVRMGSSPHARGARGPRAHALTPAGIIPACAGSTVSSPYRSGEMWDHPRMRGEHSPSSSRRSFSTGSSPHARGARHRAPGPDPLAGIIPACAGSTRLRLRHSNRRWDHPRMRGEHARPAFRPSRSLGSSPHARGAPGENERFHSNLRIIPACAGSTPAPPRRGWPGGDHPRMRGEHLVAPFPTSWFRGSSPHARGAPGPRTVPATTTGIIPACAGSTL